MRLFPRAKAGEPIRDTQVDPMPHCDARVLHAPGACEFCDLYPQWQALRQRWGIAFTGQAPIVDAERPWLSQVPCPSEVRHREVVDEWPGNRAYPPPEVYP